MQCLEECCLRARLRINQDFHEFTKTSIQVAENVVVPVWTSSCSSRLSTCFWTAALRRFLFVCNLAPPNLAAAACQHVDPTIACETFWQHQNKNNRPQAIPYVVVIYVIWWCMCAGRQCLNYTHMHTYAYTRREKKTALASTLVSHLISLATLCSCSLLFSSVVFHSVCDAVVFSERPMLLLLLVTASASASCQVILFLI